LLLLYCLRNLCGTAALGCVFILTYSRIDEAKARALSSFFQGRFEANDQIKLSGSPCRSASKNRAFLLKSMPQPRNE
jgi:hypothetical protein